jgi:thiopeptide-type bacteriocin biosynthesis protein
MSVADLRVPAPLSAAVEAVLAGGDIHAVAVAADTSPEHLTEAIETYQAAGNAALQRHSDHRWLQVYVTPTDFHAAERIFTDRAGPLLDGTCADWWFLRKYPEWRIRAKGTPAQIIPILDRLNDTDVITGWRRSVYEPETAAFGGPAAMDVVHDLFCADTAGLLDYLRHDPGGTLRREVSLILLRTLHDAAGLDPFESGAVYDTVARMRPEPPDAGSVAALAGKLTPMLHSPAGTFPAGHELEHTTAWSMAFADAGRALRELAGAGRLDRGLRRIIAHIVIFHWNRIGLPAEVQGALAHAAHAATLPRD